MKRRRFREGRGGFTLIELMVVLSVGIPLLVLASTLLQRAMDVSQHNQAMISQQLRTRQLASQFRKDVHIAAKAELTADKELVLSSASEPAVKYSFDGHRLLREQAQVDGRKRYEFYELEPDTRFEFNVSTTGDLVTLLVVEEKFGTRGKINRVVEAVPGRMFRLPTSGDSP